MPQRHSPSVPYCWAVRRLPIIFVIVVFALLGAGTAVQFFMAKPDSATTAPTIKDDEFGSVTIYSVNDDGSLKPDASGLALEVWQTFERVVTPHFAANVMTQFRVGDDDTSDTYAYVFQSYDQRYWVLADNLATSEDRTVLIATLVHEYAHILTLGQDEMRPGREICTTIQLDEGCAAEDSVIWAFDKEFWVHYGSSAPTEDNSDEDTAWAFYQKHEDDFVDDYAATSVVEDVAESFMTWVVEDDASGDSSVAKKLEFFNDYPDLVTIRERIRAEFAGELN